MCKQAKLRFNTNSVNIGGIDAEVLVDSGSECNVIGIDTWQNLKAQGINASSKESDIKLYPYASVKPLSVHSSFKAIIRAGKQAITADFVVIKDKGQPSLLGLETARSLGVLKIGLDVNNVSQCNYAKLLDRYSDLFTGLGKLKGLQVKIAVDPCVTPIAQRYSRIPFGLRAKVEAKLDELIE